MIISDVLHRSGDSGMSWFSKALTKLSGNKVPEVDFSETFIAKNVTIMTVQRLLLELNDDDLRRLWHMIGNELAKRKNNN
jgi:hypothetical protein